MADHQKHVVCLSVRNADVDLVVIGSVPRDCSRCIQAVWVAPSTLASLEEHTDAKIICEECMFTLYQGQTIVLPKPNEAQRREMDELFKGHG